MHRKKCFAKYSLCFKTGGAKPQLTGHLRLFSARSNLRKLAGKNIKEVNLADSEGFYFVFTI